MYADIGHSRHTYTTDPIYRELAEPIFVGQLSSDRRHWVCYSPIVRRHLFRLYSYAGILLWSFVPHLHGLLLLRSNGEDVVRQTVRVGVNHLPRLCTETIFFIFGRFPRSINSGIF